MCSFYLPLNPLFIDQYRTESERQELGQPWDKNQPKVDDYAGYSVGSGNFSRTNLEILLTISVKTGKLKRGESVQYILGSPRAGDRRTGEVYIIEFGQTTLQLLDTLTGWHITFLGNNILDLY